MREVVSRMQLLARDRPVRWALGLYAVAGVALVFAPVFRTVGYEWSLAGSMGIGLLGSIVGARAARLEMSRNGNALFASLGADFLASATRAFFSAVLLCALVTLVPLVACVLTALISSRCDPFAMVAFAPVLIVPSAALSVATGLLGATLFTRKSAQVGLFVILLLLSLGWTAFPVVWGPQVFAFNHYLGFVPGPLYDETLQVTPALLWFRLATLLLTFTLVVAAAPRLESRPPTPTDRAWLGLLLAGTFALETAGPQLGFRMTDERLAREFASVRLTPHLEIHVPKGKKAQDVERTVRDLEFRAAQNEAFFETAAPARVRVFWYASAAAKQQLVGAGRTQFSKPWRREIHINDDGFPHRIARHELVHAMAAPFGAPPFGVTATLFGLTPNAAVIEGMAEAAANEQSEEFTLHQWARGMKAHGLLPKMGALLGLNGFYTAASSRAYTAAGSFFRWLLETRGAAKLRAVYREGDFEGVYGATAEALGRDWEAFLDTVPSDPELLNQAFARFRRPSIFGRPCAREVAALSTRAGELAGADPDAAATLYARCASLDPDEPAYALQRAGALEKAQKLPEADAALDEALKTFANYPSTVAELAMAQGDLKRKRRDEAAARALYSRVVEVDASPSMNRTASAKLLALDEPNAVSRDAIFEYFRPTSDDVKLLVLERALQAAPGHPLLSYLLGRKLALSSRPDLARPGLLATLAAPPTPAIAREAFRLLVESDYLAGRCDDVRDDLKAHPELGTPRVAEWRERCAFEEQQFGGVLSVDAQLR